MARNFFFCTAALGGVSLYLFLFALTFYGRRNMANAILIALYRRQLWPHSISSLSPMRRLQAARTEVRVAVHRADRVVTDKVAQRDGIDNDRHCELSAPSRNTATLLISSLPLKLLLACMAVRSMHGEVAWMRENE